MGKTKKNRGPAKVATEEPGSGFGGLVSALASQGLVGSGKDAAPAVPAAAAAPSGGGDGLRGKVVVRQERKGRGGKTVTVVDGAGIRAVDDLAALAKRMRKALGTGARVEGEGIVVQGDQRESAQAWLEKQGATVVLGN